MHKWRKTNQETVILCNRCSKEQYKNLEIRERWKKTEVNQQVTCDECGVQSTITVNISD